jgi:hypothetical protein
MTPCKEPFLLVLLKLPQPFAGQVKIGWPLAEAEPQQVIP